MTMRRPLHNIVILGSVLILVFSSCVPQQQSGIDNSPFDEARMEIDRTRMKATKFVAQGDFKNALDAYTDACRKYPNDQMLLRNYSKTFQDIHRAADEAFSKEDFASSGQAYYVLQKNNSDCREPFRTPRDKGLLRARLEDCSSHLSQYALAEYRKGNLAEAISIWKSILAFDPNNERCMKAIETATIQLKNLQEKKE